MRNKIILTTIIILNLFECRVKDADLRYLIGLDINSEYFQAYLDKLETKPEVSRYDDCYYYTFKTKGISFKFTKSDTISNIFLYSEGSDGLRKFNGKIPYNIQFTDTRRDVENKLGPPDENGGGGIINFYSDWGPEGLSITYKTTDQEDMMNKIHHISLHKKVR